MMDWDKLRVFHAVAAAGSLTHAGDELHLSQSAISRQIRGLEERLNTTLFHRHARGLLLTEQGELLYEATRAITERLTLASAKIRDAKDEVFGELRVTTTVGFGTNWLAPRLKGLFARHPELSLDLILTEQLLDLPMREADVAIRMAEPNQADLIRRPLFDARMRLYAARDYLARVGAPASPEDLADHRYFSYAPHVRSPYPTRDWMAEKVAAKRHSTVVMNSYFGVMQLALNGLGIAALPDYITRNHPDLVQVLPEESSPPFTIYFVYPEELKRSKRVLAFRDFLLDEVTEFLKAHPPEG